MRQIMLRESGLVVLIATFYPSLNKFILLLG